MEFDAVIIGGGIVGTAQAYYLAKKGLSVCLLEKDALARGTSANNFSWINGTSKTSNADYHHLNALGVQLYDKLADQFGAESLGLNRVGAIGITHPDDALNHSAMRAQLAKLDEFGYPARWVDGDELRALEPNLSYPVGTEGVLSPTDKCLDASRFVALLASEIRAMGGQLSERCPAQSLIVDDDGSVTGVLTQVGEVLARRVIIAAGPDTPEVLSDLTGYDGFATRFPVRKVPGLLVTTPPVEPDLVRHLNYMDVGGEFHFFPDFNGGLRLGSDDADGQITTDASPENLTRLAGGLLRRMKEFAPSFAGESCLDQCKLSVGVRAYPEDGHSIAGPLPDAEGVFVVATHSGVTLAPALGQLMADLVVDGEMPGPLAPFGLERLPGFG